MLRSKYIKMAALNIYKNTFKKYCIINTIEQKLYIQIQLSKYPFRVVIRKKTEFYMYNDV